MFNNWAMPVIRPHWAVVSGVLYRLHRLTGWRLPLAHPTHVAWQRAVGVS